ncbi:MAG: alpha/beta fold hydrolase [Anaerolineae bacterium]|nr:alpha/beta fold hydrolase [Anaerolineae bacterium]
MTTGYLPMDDGKLYYEMSEGGAGKATLVLSHALFLDSRMWDDQWAAFSQAFRVVRYDMRGNGRSDVATGPRCRREDLYQLLRHLEIEQAHLLGCSVGGEISIDLALEHPALVQSLVLVNSAISGFEMQGPPPAPVMEMIGAMQAGDLERTSELQLQIWFDGPHRLPTAVNAAQRQRASDMNRLYVQNGTFAIADMQPLNPLTPPAVNRLGEIAVPTLVISGALDYAENQRASALLADSIPGAQMVTLTDSAHVPNLDHPVAFNQCVLDFMNRLP